MKLKPILALLSLSACFACSSGSSLANGTTTNALSSQENDITYLTITFDLNGGTYNSSSTFELNNVLPTTYWKHLADKAPGSTSMPIVYPYHNFKGYSLSKDDTDIIPNNYVVKDNITVYAQYTTEPDTDCDVKWLDDTTELASEVYVVGETPTFKGTIPIHQGETFDHWEPTPSAITQAQAEAGEVINYNAVYVPVAQGHTVTLNYNNGSENIHTQHIDQGGKATEPSITYTGHHLVNWTYTAGGSGVFTFDTTITADISIKANWEVDEYTITYIPNGGTITSSINKATYNGTIATAPVMTRDGYDVSQVTWWTDQACTTSEFTFGAVGTGTPVTGPTTLYAKWGTIQSVEITFDANGGYFDTTTETSKVVSTTYGQIPVAPTPKIDVTDEYTYSFKGWDKTLEPAKPASEGGTVLYKAQWNPTKNSYHVTFDANGGTITSGSSSLDVTYGETIAVADRPTVARDGYTATTDWYDAPTGGTQFVFGTSTVTKNMTLYAKWGTIQSVEITFDANGGYFDTTAETSKVVSTTYGQIPVAPTPKRDVTDEYTYSFKGWDKTLEPAKPESEGGTVLYKAQWNPTKNSYHVTFDANGGSITSEVSSLDVTYGETIAVADRPTVARDGYTATTDWYDAPTGGTQFVFGTSTVTKNMTLYARWGSIKTYTVHFFDDSATPVEYTDLKETGIEYNQRAWRPVTDPTKTDYTFDGWYTTKDHTTAFDFSVPLTGSDADVNVYAKFSEKQYRVRWLNADIDHTPLVEAEYYDAGEIPTYKGSTPTLAPDINHRYKFKGFSPEIVPVDDNMTYYATYDYNDEIDFHYVSDSYPLNGEFEYRSVECYGGLIVMGFTDANIASEVLNNAAFTIDGTQYTTEQLSTDLYQGETEEHNKTNYLYLKVGYASANTFVRDAQSIEMEVMCL